MVLAIIPPLFNKPFMDYAVVNINKKQEKISLGQVLDVDRMDLKEGQAITFSEVLLTSIDGKVLVGNPYLEGAEVTAKAVGSLKGTKIYVSKYKQKVRYRRRTGFRSLLTKIQITSLPGKKLEKTLSEKEEKKTPEKTVKKTVKPKKAKTAEKK